MPTHKIDITRLSVNQISQLTGKAYNTIRRRLAGLDPVDRDGRTLIYLASDALLKIYGEREETEQDRLHRLRGDRVAHDLAISRGAHLPVDELARVWSVLVTAFRSHMLSLPGKLAPVLAGETSRAKCRAILQKEIHAALTQLSNHKIKITGGGGRKPEQTRPPC